MEKNIIKQAKADIFKELYTIINFYIKKGAKPQSLKKFYKNNKRFNDVNVRFLKLNYIIYIL